MENMNIIKKMKVRESDVAMIRVVASIPFVDRIDSQRAQNTSGMKNRYGQKEGG